MRPGNKGKNGEVLEARAVSDVTRLQKGQYLSRERYNLYSSVLVRFGTDGKTTTGFHREPVRGKCTFLVF